MRLMERNKRAINYCLFKGLEPSIDEFGNETGEFKTAYEQPVEISVVVSAANGTAQGEIFGTLESYDKVILTDDMSCPIDENSVLFVDKAPEFDENGLPAYDYRVVMVAKSLNHIAYAVSKAVVS